jgi:hypothetical protein
MIYFKGKLGRILHQLPKFRSTNKQGHPRVFIKRFVGLCILFSCFALKRPRQDILGQPLRLVSTMLKRGRRSRFLRDPVFL